MKKKILGIVVMTTIALASGWNIYQNDNNSNFSDLVLGNVEALANEKTNDMCPNGCTANGDGCYCNGWHPTYKEA